MEDKPRFFMKCEHYMDESSPVYVGDSLDGVIEAINTLRDDAEKGEELNIEITTRKMTDAEVDALPEL